MRRKISSLLLVGCLSFALSLTAFAEESVEGEAVLAQEPVVQTDVVNVNLAAQDMSIQEAVNVSQGAKVSVEIPAGVYNVNEAVQIVNDTTLVLDAQAVLVVDGNLFNSSNSDATLSIQGGCIEFNGDASILNGEATNVFINNTTINANGAVITLSGADLFDFAGTVINNGSIDCVGEGRTVGAGQTLSGVTINGAAPFGIRIMAGGNKAKIVKCTISNTGGNGINIVSSSNVTVSDTTIKNSSGYGIYTETAKELKVDNCKLLGNAATGIILQKSSDNSSVTNSEISDNKQNGVWVFNSNGCQVNNNTVNSNPLGIAVQNSDSTKIDGNTVTGGSNYAIVGFNTPNLSVTNNKCASSGIGIQVSNDTEKSLQGAAKYPVTVTGNTTENTAKEGIDMVYVTATVNNNTVINPARAAGEGLILRFCVNSTVSGNKVTGTLAHSGTGDGIIVADSLSVVVDGNTVDNSGRHGIQVWSGATNITVQNNKITGTGWHGINYVTNCSGTCSGNIIKNAGIHGILLQNAGAVNVTGNSVVGFGQEAIGATGTKGGSITNNKLYYRPGQNARVLITNSTTTESNNVALPISSYKDDDNNNNNNNNNGPYNDVPEGKWYTAAVRYVKDNGIMSGTGGNNFEPNTTTTRAMVVQILYNMEGKPSNIGNNKFSDVNPSAWYGPAVIWASNQGIVNGSNGAFKPLGTVTRQDLAVMLYNYAKFKKFDTSAQADLSKFADNGSISSYARTALSWANAKGVVNGSGSNIDPKGSASRAMVAQMIYNFKTNIK